MGRRFRFHSLHVPYADSLNDEAIDSNMDINCAEMILKHVLDEQEGVKEAVNALFKELAERVNAEGQKRARETCEAVTNGDSMPLHRFCPVRSQGLLSRSMFSLRTPKAALTPQVSTSTSRSRADERAGERRERATSTATFVPRNL